MKDEFSLIQKIAPKKTYQSSLIQGIGDDAALFRAAAGYDEIVCTDTLVEGVHFLQSTMRPFHIGYKALAANLSDIAAMGGIPLFYLVSIAVPPAWAEEDVLEIYEGMRSLAERYQIDLIGGDTCAAPNELVVTVTVIGRVEKGRHLFRSQARPGDVVFITNTVGNAAAGLELLLKKNGNEPYSEEEAFFVSCHQTPAPQVEFGRFFAESGVRIALNDISDGVASEAHEIAENSEVSLILYPDSLPFHPYMKRFSGEKQLDFALYGGEDFQLIGTAAKSDWEKIKKECAQKGWRITEVGTVMEGKGVYLEVDDRLMELEKRGYNHFRKR